MTLFATHLLRTHSSFSDRSRGLMRGGLSAKTVHPVTEFIAENLSKDLSIGRLAEVAGLSPSHFLRALRQTSGQPPHRAAAYRSDLWPVALYRPRTAFSGWPF